MTRYAGTRRTTAAIGGLAVVTVLAAGCGSSTAKRPAAASSPSSSQPIASTFDDQNGQTLRCMAHQTRAPSAGDKPATPSTNVIGVLTYLRYYTANGDKGYCDGKPATATDRQWLDLFVYGGGARSKVSAALGSPAG